MADMMEQYFAKMIETRTITPTYDLSAFEGKVFQYHVHVIDLNAEANVSDPKLPDFIATIPASFTLSQALQILENQWGQAFLTKHNKPAILSIAYVQMAHDPRSINYNLPIGYLFPHGTRIVVHAECIHVEVIEPLKDSEKIPVLLVTGFLGSGKTTLMNYILTGNHGKKFAVIQNEFGSIDVDGKLVQAKLTTKEDIQILDNGCMCCTVRGDLIEALTNIVKKIEETDSEMDGVLIETTGMADPQPVLAVFSQDSSVGNFMRLDSVLTVVDTKRISEQLDRKVDDGVNEAVQQVIFADRLLLNKSDTVTPEEMKSAQAKIRSINSFCRMHPTTFSQISLDKIFDQQSHSLEKLGDLGVKILETPKEEKHHHDHSDHENCDHEHHKEHGHGHKEGGHGHGAGHGHGHKKEHEHGHKQEHGHGHGHGKNDDHAHENKHDHSHEKKDDHKHEKKHDHGHEKKHDHDSHGHGKHDHKHGHKHDHKHHHSHRHSSGVSSVGFSKEGELDLKKLNLFIQNLLKEKMKDLYRYKGICAVQGHEDKFVLQGVHESVQFDWMSKWGENEKKNCTMVFIGKDLEKEKLEEGFNACFVQNPKRTLENAEDRSLAKRQKV